MKDLGFLPADAEEFQGLTPRAWICVGAGFSREDIKARLLSRGISFVGDAVQTFPGLCQKIAQIDSASVLASPGRQEVLRLLLSVAGLRDRFPELARLKRQGTFLRRLDRAIQAGRMAFAHWQEAEVYSERLKEKLGENPLRNEIEILAHLYEEWLTGARLWDPPLVIRRAIERLNEETDAKLPGKIYYLRAQTQESLEKSFWEAICRQTEVREVGAETFQQLTQPRVRWERWHTLDDAAEALACSLAERVRKGEGLGSCVALISDIPSSRRTLRRALSQRGAQLSDPRDPTRTRWDEMIKWAMLPLDVVARGFERARVIAYLRHFSKTDQAISVREIQERGIRNGLESYSGGKLAPAHADLTKLNARLGGKRTVSELARAHLEFLSANLPEGEPWVLTFFEQIWKQMLIDLERVGLGERRAAPLYWLERLSSRVSEAPPPVEKVKPHGGLDVYRLHQAPSRVYPNVFVFGLPPLWLSAEGLGEYWFSEREREILASEFSVRSGIQVRSEQIAALKAWFSGAEEVVFLDSLYDPDGRERESILSVLEEIIEEVPEEVRGQASSSETSIIPLDLGSHPRWMKSYGALRPIPPQRTELSALSPSAGMERPMISASALENYSRCGFLALARSRWKLEDLVEPDTDLWPQVKGILLHEAVRLLVESRDSNGSFSKPIEEAIDQAWAAKRPRGLLRGARIEAYVKRKLGVLLRVFQEQERKYVQRAGTRVLGLENVELQSDYPKFSIHGEPDRIDEHSDGIWIIDYKTSSSAPNGSTMLENGYRLQLPFYALAAQVKFGKSALGFQFVQIDRKGTRTNGVYFKSHNGKEPGKLTETTSRSKSLLSLPREEVWSRFDEQIDRLGASFVSGVFEAKPRIKPRSKECDSCQVSDFCGYRRLLEEDE